LAEMAGVYASGRPTSAIAVSINDEEFEKELKSALLDGRQVIGLDNCDRKLRSSLLCIAVTARGEQSVRGFGTLKTLNFLNTAVITVTGNNLEIAGDLIDRSLLCSIDPACANPEERHFDFDPIVHATKYRVEAVRAILTIARAYQQTKDKVGVKPWGSFEEWSQMIREPLVWLGMQDPRNTAQTIRENDKDTNNLIGLIEQWPLEKPRPEPKNGATHVTVGMEMTARELVDHVQPTPKLRPDCPTLYETLFSIAPSKDAKSIDPTRLTYFLRDHKGQYIRNRRIMPSRMTSNVWRWTVEERLGGEQHQWPEPEKPVM